MQPSPEGTVPQPNRISSLFIKLLPVVLIIILVGGFIIVFLRYKKNPMKEASSVSQQSKENKKNLKVAQPLVAYKAYDSNLQQGPFTCPVNSSLCKDKSSFKNKDLVVKVSSSSPVLAAFDGEVTALKSVHPSKGKNEEFVSVVLVNKQKGLIANYFFKGKAETKKTVKEGDKVATANGQPLSFLDDQSFKLELIKIGEKGGQELSLAPASFK